MSLLPELWATGKCFRLKDNARPRKGSSVKELLPVHQITALPHAPYPPDLSPSDFSYSHYRKEQWKNPLICWHSGHPDGRDKTALHNCRKCCPCLLQRRPTTLEAVDWCRRKLFRRRSLAPECKYTITTFIMSVSELSGQVVCMYIYLYTGMFIPYTSLRTVFYNGQRLFSSDIWTGSLYTLRYISAFKTENKLARSLTLGAVNLETFLLTKPATVCGINSTIRGTTYYTKPEMTEVLWTEYPYTCTI